MDRLPLLALLLFSCCAAAPPPAASSRAVVFKDGYALITRSWTAVTDANGEIHVDDVPDAAVLGSFWAGSAQGRLLGMRAGFAEVNERGASSVRATSHFDILAANPGAHAEVRYAEATYVGKVGAVLGDTNEVSAGDGLVTERITGRSFVLETADGSVVLPTGGIRALFIKNMKLDLERPTIRRERRKRLTLRFAKSGVRRDVTLTYFRPGIRWIPTYRLDLIDDRRAKLSLQAELINEAEDLIDVPVDVVVGVPNFRFRDTVSPLALERAMKNALVQAAPQLMGQMSNSLSKASYGARSTEHRQAQAQQPIDGGTANAELFVTSLGKMTLKNGERAAVPVFERTVPYRNVYTWNVRLKTENEAVVRSAARSDSPLDVDANDVWQQLELTNTTDSVWTTGAVMIMEGHRPLAQELLTYAGPGDIVRVPVTVAVQVRGTASTKESGRELDALTWSKKKYARIDNQLKLDLCNKRPVPIDVEITLRLGGRASTATHEGRIELGRFRDEDWVGYRGARAVNHSSVVRWKTRLAPGAVFAPTVDYGYFTPR